MTRTLKKTIRMLMLPWLVLTGGAAWGDGFAGPDALSPCPTGARLIGDTCYCYTTGTQTAVDPAGVCPDNPACDTDSASACDGNFDCCCAIQNVIHRGQICKGCLQLPQRFCRGYWPE